MPPKTKKGAGRSLDRVPKAQVLDPWEQPPSFSLKHIDKASTHSFHFNLSSEDAGEIFAFLCDIGTTKWKELRSQTYGGGQSRHRRNHDMEISVLCSDAQKRITSCKLDEITDEMFRFRLTNAKRLWGFVNDGCFYAVWWDPEHHVYPTETR